MKWLIDPFILFPMNTGNDYTCYDFICGDFKCAGNTCLAGVYVTGCHNFTNCANKGPCNSVYLCPDKD